MVRDILLASIATLDQLRRLNLSGTAIFKLPFNVCGGKFFEGKGLPLYLALWRYPRRARRPHFSVFSVDDYKLIKGSEGEFTTNEEFVEGVKKGVEELLYKTESVNETPSNPSPYVFMDPVRTLSYEDVREELHELEDSIGLKQEVKDFFNATQSLYELEGFTTAFVSCSSITRIDKSNTRQARQHLYLALDKQGFYFRSKVNEEKTFDKYHLFFSVLPHLHDDHPLYVNLPASLVYNKAGNFILAGDVKDVARSVRELARKVPPAQLLLYEDELKKILETKKKPALIPSPAPKL
jgi:hypothetical protein